MLKLQIEAPPLPPGAEWRWTRVTNICGLILVAGGFVAHLAGHIPAAPLAYYGLAIVVFAFGAWRRATHLAAFIRRAETRLAETERLAAIGLSTVAFAHEMKNGVMVAHGFAELCHRSAENAGASANLLNQLQSLETQTTQLATDLQAFVALSRGEGPTNGAIPLRTALDRTWHMLAPLARTKNLELESALDEVPDRPVADPGFRQGLLNLGLNAVEHARTRVRLQVAKQDGEVLLSVEDDGPGIPAAERKQLFTPFFSRRPDGTGLGLAQTRQAVEREGGRISYEEVDGGGARFKVRLPAVKPS